MLCLKVGKTKITDTDNVLISNWYLIYLINQYSVYSTKFEFQSTEKHSIIWVLETKVKLL